MVHSREMPLTLAGNSGFEAGVEKSQLFPAVHLDHPAPTPAGWSGCNDNNDKPWSSCLVSSHAVVPGSRSCCAPASATSCLQNIIIASYRVSSPHIGAVIGLHRARYHSITHPITRYVRNTVTLARCLVRAHELQIDTPQSQGSLHFPLEPSRRHRRPAVPTPSSKLPLP